MGHMAVWLGLYFTATYAAAALLLGRALVPAALLGSFCAGMAIYLLDRLKVRDALLDRADLAADPHRHHFLRAHARFFRQMIWGLVFIGTVSVMLLSLANILLPVVGVGGVILYTHRAHTGQSSQPNQPDQPDPPAQPRARLKDRLLIKNLLPGGAIAGFGTMLALQSPTGSSTPFSIAAIAVVVCLTILVTTDAALCDIDDQASDKAHGTRTLPIVLGVRWTWITAIGLQLLAGLGLLGVLGRAEPARSVILWWTGVNLGANIVLCSLPVRSLRDLVDLKMPVVITIVWLLV